MYTLCPSCKTLFGINAQQLAAAQGRVRCGVCRAAFNALDNLSEQPDALLAPTGAPVASAAPTETAPLVSVQSAAAVPEAIIAMRTAPAGAVTVEEFDLVNAPPIVAGEPLAPDSGAVIPPAGGPKRISLGATLSWSVINLALMAVLVIQFAYFNRDDLARYAQWRPALEEMCRHAGCTLPLQSDITKITLLNRELRSHPRVANALLVTATLVNSAAFPQTYPVLQLSLSDFSGRTVAMRRFQPAEYMSKTAEVNGGMRPGQPVEISLELADPGKTAVGFEFTFI